MSPRESAWERLRRRKVVQWGIAYAAAAWLFLQVLEYVTESFDWPPVARRIAIIALLLGLPIALVLAWFHGDRGAQRVSKAELSILTLMCLAAGTLLWHYYNADGRAHEDATVSPSRIEVAEPDPARTPRLAVMPLENLSPDPANAYFADGLHDEILTALATSPDLQVISRTTMRAYRDVPKTIRQIAEEIGAGYVLEGSVRRSGDRVRLLVQLVDAADDRPLWSQAFDREMKDALNLQQEIAAEVARTLNLRAGTNVDSFPTTSSAEAYDLYLKARVIDERNDFSNSSMREVERLCSEVIRIDPTYSAAYALRAISRLRRLWFYADLSEAEWRDVASDIDTASRLTPGDTQALRARVWYAYYGEMDYRGALEQVRGGLKSYPFDPGLRELSGLLLRRLGDFESAAATFRSLTSIEPSSALYAHSTTETLRMSRRYTESSATARAYLERAPLDPVIRFEEYLGQALQHGSATALRAFVEQQAASLDPENLSVWRTQVLRLSGDDSGLAAHLATYSELVSYNGGFISPVALVRGYSKLLRGDPIAPAEARGVLEQASRVGRFPQREYNVAFLEAGAALLTGDLEIAKERALRTARLMPVTRDAVLGPETTAECAVILAWAGAREEAVEMLRRSLAVPNGLTPLEIRNDPLLTKPLSGFVAYEELKASLPVRFGT